MVKDRNTGAYLLNNAHLMGDDNDGDAEFVMDIPDKRKNRLRCLRVKRTCSLVAEKNFRVGRKRSCYCHSLLLAAGKLNGIALELIAEADDFKKLFCTGCRLGFFNSRKLHGEAYVFKTGALHEQVEALENHRDLSALIAKLGFAELADVGAVYYNIALCRTLKHIDTADKRAFACAAHADNAVNLAVVNFE